LLGGVKRSGRAGEEGDGEKAQEKKESWEHGVGRGSITDAPEQARRKSRGGEGGRLSWAVRFEVDPENWTEGVVKTKPETIRRHVEEKPTQVYRRV
jgi:hypothetical protein